MNILIGLIVFYLTQVAVVLILLVSTLGEIFKSKRHFWYWLIPLEPILAEIAKFMVRCYNSIEDNIAKKDDNFKNRVNER